jgi:DNA-binding transcriptional ArsR family regulator
MRVSRLETIVKHDGRLGLLCCLLDAGPQSGSQLAIRTSESLRAVRYWLRLLEPAGLVVKLADPGGGEPLYAAALDEHPGWVREAVDDYRARCQLDSEFGET